MRITFRLCGLRTALSTPQHRRRHTSPTAFIERAQRPRPPPPPVFQHNNTQRSTLADPVAVSQSLSSLSSVRLDCAVTDHRPSAAERILQIELHGAALPGYWVCHFQEFRRDLVIYSFIHYATEAAHITLQTYKIKHKVKTQSIKNSKNTTQQRNQIQISTV